MNYVDDLFVINMSFGGEGPNCFTYIRNKFKKICMQNKLKLLMHLFDILN